MNGTMAEVRLFAGNFAPRTWAYCAGQLLSINANQALFSLLGTIYGGDGRTTFALPDLRSRTAIGEGTGPGLSHFSLGERTGQAYVTLISTQIPSHTHTVATNLAGAVAPGCSTEDATSDDPSGAYPALPPGGETIYNSNSDGVMANAPLAISGNVDCLTAGGSQYHNNMQPFLAMNYIICMQGIFPSRN